MAKKVRSDLRGVPPERLTVWQHHLDQMAALEEENLRGTRPVLDRSKRKRVKFAADLGYDIIHRGMRNRNLSMEQFRDLGAQTIESTRNRMRSE
jgi:hypothetical protein